MTVHRGFKFPDDDATPFLHHAGNPPAIGLQTSHHPANGQHCIELTYELISDPEVARRGQRFRNLRHFVISKELRNFCSAAV